MANEEQKDFLDIPGLTHLWAELKKKFSTLNHGHDAMTGASSTADGKIGMVPAPAMGKQASFLRGDGTWAAPDGDALIVRYGETSFADVENAVNAGKVVVCYYNGMYLHLTESASGLFYVFYGCISNAIIAAVIDSETGWTNAEQIGYEPMDHEHKIPKAARFVVGTSTNGWTENDCDFLCDGTDDEEEIRRALWSVPNEGGEVILLDGTYNIGETITVNSNGVVLRGNGIGTILARAFDGGEIIDFNMVATNCTVRDLCFDGKKATYTSTSNISVAADGTNISILNCIVKDSSYYGISVDGSSCIVANNTCNGNEVGIRISGGESNMIADNILTGNGRYGISNMGSNKSTITGNVCNGNGSYGIYFNSGEHCAVTGNTCNGNNHGINMSYGEFNTFTGNSCGGNETGIRVYSDHNNCTGNVCCGNEIGIDVYYSGYNSVTGNTCLANTTCNLRVNGAHDNIICGNNLVVASDDDTIPTYALQLTGSDTANNIVKDNHVGTGTISNAGGTGNIVCNPGYTYGTTDLTAGTSALSTGQLHFVYE